MAELSKALKRYARLLLKLPLLHWLAALLISLLFAYRFGLAYGVSNQVAYLLGGIRQADPSVLATDWYCTQTTQYHQRFDYVVALLTMLDGSGWSIAIANFVSCVALALLIYACLTKLTTRALAFPAYLLVVVLLMTTRTVSVAVSYLVHTAFQPSTLGAVGLLAAIALFLRGRWLASGAALAVGGLFHANFLVLGIPVFGLAHLLVSERREPGESRPQELGKRLGLQLALPVVAMLFILPVALAATSGDVEAGRELLFRVRSPHHYNPKRFKDALFIMAAWQMLAAGAGWHHLHKAGKSSRCGAVFIALVAALWSGTVLTTWTFIPSVAQAFVWRLAPFSDLLSQLLVALALVEVIADPAALRRYRGAPLVLVAAGLGSLIAGLTYQKNDNPIDVVIAMVAVGAITLAAGFLRRGAKTLAPSLGAELDRPVAWLRGTWLVCACAAVFAYGAEDPIEDGSERSNLMLPRGKLETELYAWVHSNTSKADQFVTPPEFDGFRFYAQRPIVVDWKSAPMLPNELLPWAERLRDVSGVKQVQSEGQVTAGYRQIDEQRMERLKAKYGLRYAVLRGSRSHRLKRYPVVFTNRKWTVIDLSAAAAPKDKAQQR